MLDDGKEGGGGGLPPTGQGGRVTHFQDVADELRWLGWAWFLQGEWTAKALSGTGARRSSRRGLSGGHKVHLTGTRPARGSRGCLVAIDGHIHGVLTLGFWGLRSGEASRSRSSRTFLKGGTLVITAVAAMEGRGRTKRLDWLIVPAVGTGWILTSVSRASMVKGTNEARWVGGGASLSSVSVSPAVVTLGGAAC